MKKISTNNNTTQYPIYANIVQYLITQCQYRSNPNVNSDSINGHIISYHSVDLKQQNRLKVGTNMPKLKVNMQSVSDDDIRKELLEKPRFELAAKGVFRLGRRNIFPV